ncbi:class I SAM-dependent methyltransferase [Candidatus Woesearchaeota archaeon]|nr:class I SAM-dependent methyltransferase [Candidatus Woesearchaeota archaeon]
MEIINSQNERYREAWEKKKILRRFFYAWYDRFRPYLEKGNNIVEFAGGTGTFKDYWPESICTDIELTRHVDLICDATRPPFAKGSVDAAVVIHGIHHFMKLDSFFDEMLTILKPGGKLIIVEPFLSPPSYLMHRFFHHENVDMKNLDVGNNAQDGNTAIATVLFFKRLKSFKNRHPGFRIVKRDLFGSLYPLIGGYCGISLIPNFMAGLLIKADRAMPFKRLHAFKTLIVLEKITGKNGKTDNNQK